MIPNKLRVKVPAPAFEPPALARVIESFHTWIAEGSLPELLVDVADYRHMFQGPGIVLIGHESNYQFDEQRGQFGLSCFRKRAFVDHVNPIGDVLARVWYACELLQQGLCASQELFDTSTLEISIADRLVTELSTFDMAEFAWSVRQCLATVYEGNPDVEVIAGASLPTLRAHGSPRAHGSSRALHELRARVLECTA